MANEKRKAKLKLSDVFVNAEGRRATRGTAEDFSTIADRGLARIRQHFGRHPNSHPLTHGIDLYNEGRYAEALGRFAEVGDGWPELWDEVAPHVEVCQRVLVVPLDEKDRVYERAVQECERILARKARWPRFVAPVFNPLISRRRPKPMARCKYCGHYTPRIDQRFGHATLASVCQSCGRSYPMPHFLWDGLDGLAYNYYRGVDLEDAFYWEMEEHFNIDPVMRWVDGVWVKIDRRSAPPLAPRVALALPAAAQAPDFGPSVEVPAAKASPLAEPDPRPDDTVIRPRVANKQTAEQAEMSAAAAPVASAPVASIRAPRAAPRPPAEAPAAEEPVVVPPIAAEPVAAPRSEPPPPAPSPALTESPVAAPKLTETPAASAAPPAPARPLTAAESPRAAPAAPPASERTALTPPPAAPAPAPAAARAEPRAPSPPRSSTDWMRNFRATHPPEDDEDADAGDGEASPASPRNDKR